MKNTLLLTGLLAWAQILFAQDYFTGKMTSDNGVSTSILYDRTQFLVSTKVHQTLYKVFDSSKKPLYNIFVTHDQENTSIAIAVSIEGKGSKGTFATYDKQKCGLIFSNTGNIDTSFTVASTCNYLVSFTDTLRDYPILHKIKTAEGAMIELDPLTKLRVHKHVALVQKFYPAQTTPLSTITTSTHNTELATETASNVSTGINDAFNKHLFVLRDSLYAKNAALIESITAIRTTVEGDIAKLMKDAHVYSDEERYGGQEKNGVPQGQGVLIANGNIYDGLFADGVFANGKAIIKTKQSVYYGESAKDSMMGKGWLKYTNGSFILGEFKNGKMVDGISLAKDNGEVFFGSFKANQRTGYGELRNSRGDSYYGEFLNGRLIKGYSKEIDQFGYSTYSKIENGAKGNVTVRVAEAFFDTVHALKDKAESMR